MHRFLSTILLICFGVLAPQVVPMRLCLLDSESVSAGSFAHANQELASCCQDCGIAKVEVTGEDCCLDIESLSDSTVPFQLEKRLMPMLVVGYMLENRWRIPFIQEIAKVHPLHDSTAPSVTAAERQATLSLWTV